MTATLSHGARAGLSRARERLAMLLVVVVIAATAVGTERLLREPDFVSRVTVENPTDYLVDVRVTNTRGDGWVGLDIVEPRRTTSTHEVLDQGDEWRFEIRSGGVVGGTLRRTRAQLERAGWRVVVPDAVTRQLEQARVRPAPR